MKKLISLILIIALSLSLVACGTKKVSSIVMSNSNIEIIIGEEYTLSAVVLPEDAKEAITWKSANESIATIDNTGKVTAVSIGSTTIIVSSKSGISATCAINVIDKSSYDKLGSHEQKFVDVFTKKCLSYFKVPDSVVIREIGEYEGSVATYGDFWLFEASSTNGFGGTTVDTYFLSMDGREFVKYGDKILLADDYNCDLITKAIHEK